MRFALQSALCWLIYNRDVCSWLSSQILTTTDKVGIVLPVKRAPALLSASPKDTSSPVKVHTWTSRLLSSCSLHSVRAIDTLALWTHLHLVAQEREIDQKEMIRKLRKLFLFFLLILKNMFSQSLECLWKCFLLSWLNNRYEHCLSLSESGSGFSLMENPFLAQFRAMIVESSTPFAL